MSKLLADTPLAMMAEAIPGMSAGAREAIERVGIKPRQHQVAALRAEIVAAESKSEHRSQLVKLYASLSKKAGGAKGIGSQAVLKRYVRRVLAKTSKLDAQLLPSDLPALPATTDRQLQSHIGHVARGTQTPRQLYQALQAGVRQTTIDRKLKHKLVRYLRGYEGRPEVARALSEGAVARDVAKALPELPFASDDRC
jgi:hypothetical protein